MNYSKVIITISLMALTAYLCVTASPTAYLTPIYLAIWVSYLQMIRIDFTKKEIPQNNSQFQDIINLSNKVSELQTSVDLVRIKR